MRLLVVAAVACAWVGPALHAQAPRHRIMAGLTLTSMNAFDGDVGTDLGPGLIVRGVPRRGFGPVIDVSAFTVGLKRSPERRDLGELSLRAVLLGLGYTVETGRLATTFTAAAGYAFNGAETSRELSENERSRFDAKDRPLFRSGVTFTWAAGGRLALVSSVGMLFVDPAVTLTTNDSAGRPLRVEAGTWRANALVWEAGLAFKLF